jgi:hypothetical protein
LGHFTRPPRSTRPERPHWPNRMILRRVFPATPAKSRMFPVGPLGHIPGPVTGRTIWTRRASTEGWTGEGAAVAREEGGAGPCACGGDGRDGRRRGGSTRRGAARPADHT